jgi:hypothetical protein
MKTIFAYALAAGVLMTTNPARADTRGDGAFLNRITNRYVTPHLDWATPLAGGAPKVLFIVPRKAAREVVELGERLAIEPQSVVAFSPATLAYDSIYESLIEGTGAGEKAREVAEKLNGDYDAIVLANVDFKALSVEAQYRILEKVSNGAGLLFFYPRAPQNPKLFSARTDDWKQILQMADVSTLPGDAAKNADKLLKTYRFGKGRIGAISYPGTSASVGGGVALTAFEEYSPRGWKAHYENNMALVARAVQWAARRDISATVIPQWPESIVAGTGVLLPLQAQNVQSGTVHLRVRDEWNTVQWSGEASIQNGNIAPAQLPPLAAGAHYLDVRLEQNGKISAFGAFGAFGFEVASPVGKIEISTDKDSYERGENVAVQARLERPLQERAEVIARLEDLPQRNIWQRRLGVLPAGTQNIKLDFPDVKLPSIAGAIVIEIQRDKKTLLKSERVAFFPRREREIFPTLLWDVVPSYLTPMYAGQLIGNMNDPAGLTHPSPEIARVTALVNQRLVPYMTRIGLSAGKDGQTINNQWLGMSKEESEAATKGEGSFNDPAVRAFWKKNIERRIEGVPHVGPMIYTLGDENSFSYDAGYSPADNAAWPKFLQSRYGSIAKLNREWGAEYSRFEDGPHFSPQQMRDKRMFPAWYEHRRFMEKQYADVHHFLAQTIKEIDPHAIVGAEGSVPGELEQTISGLEFWGPYSDAVGDELLRSIGRDKLRMLWWGYGPAATANGPYALWRPLLQGVVNGSAWYSSGIESMGLLSVDLSFADYFQKLRPALRELDGGQAQTLIETPLKNDGIAILWSHASHSASFMDDRFFKPTDSATAFMNFCYRNGLNFDYVTTQMAESGALKDYKVLCLFGASALSEKEVAAIEAFAQRGGVVIADINPGILSEYLRPLEKSRLADFFGAPHLQGKADLQLRPLKVNANVRGEQISLSAASVFQSPEAPVFAAREVGKGEAILLNFNLGSAHNTTQDKDSFDQFLLDLLKLGHVAPEIAISGLSSDQAILRVRQDGANQVIGVLAAPGDAGHVLTLRLPQTGWIYEVNKGFLGHAAQWQAKLDTPFKVYSVFPEKQKAPDLKLSRSRASAGEGVLLDTARLSPDGIYRVDIFAPSGELIKDRTHVFTGANPGNVGEIRFAYNDAPGDYRVVLTDVRTGLQASREVRVM